MPQPFEHLTLECKALALVFIRINHFFQSKQVVRLAPFPHQVDSSKFPFSKHTLDQTMKVLRGSDVPIFCVGLGKTWTNFLDSRGSMSPHMDYLQAENQLRTFAQETGGFAWFPQFDGEIPDIFRSVAAFLRHQYSLSFTPSGGGKDGKFHKVKVELVAPDGAR